ncbi:purine-binding chemotaxis protein CheW [Persephonella hydrogeniphila]|uniref:Purine-binding chemotaxis protein CheW n=1 Tax=Persephonella hydrogeniphila TaxID=198703 RepID=A0A285NF72_9AQUI|nr:chemotaxis protein CheW [Persephonella hydrogeniphila]SNZ08152.1 purine-binding chemotaxis protein CheW [Persephonella hydrogeniphila]
MSEIEVLGMREIEKEVSREERLITFYLNDELVGVNIKDVIKITKDIDITPVPKTKDYILGVMNLRGNIIPVVSLKKKFNLDGEDNIEHPMIVVVETELGHIGITVDKVEGAINIDPEEIQPPPMNSIGIDPEFIDGVVMIENESGKKELLTLLNIKKIFRPENL